MTADETPVLNRIRRWLSQADPAADGELIRRFAQDRDEAAFAALVDRHGPMVLATARRIVGDHHTAEDVFQATFLMLARRADRLHRPESLGAWLHRTAHQLALTEVRTRVRRDPAAAPAPARMVGDPLADLSAREFVAILDAEIQRLPERLRQVLVLCCLEGRSQEETAGLLGCSPDSVRGRLERGRRRLRDRLVRRGLTLAVVAGPSLLLGPPIALAGSLRESAIRVATGGATPSTAVAGLVEPDMRLVAMRWVGVSAAMVGAISIGALAIVLSQSPNRDPAPAAKGVSAPPPARTDDVPLPTGAVARVAWDPLRIGHAQAALTPDGKKVIAVGEGAVVHTFDAATGKLLERRALGDRRELPPESWNPVLSADGSVAAIEDGYHSYHCTVWNLATGERLLERPGNSRTRSLSGVGRYLAVIEHVTARNDWAIRVYDVTTGESRDAAYTGAKAIPSLWLTPDGKRVIARAQEGGGALICHDVAGAKQLWTAAPASGVTACTFTTDGRTVIVADSGAKERFRALDVETGRPVESFRPPDYKTFDSAAAAGDRLLLVPLRSGEVAVWDYRAGKELLRLRATAKSFITVNVFPAADGKTALTDGDGLRRWNLETGEQIFGPAGEPPHYGSVHALAFVSDWQLASVAAGGELRLWDVATGQPTSEVRRAGGSEVWMTRVGPRTVKLDYAKALLNVVDAAGKAVGKFAITDDPRALSSGAKGWHHRILGDGRTALTYFQQSDGQKATARVTATDYVASKKLSQVEITLPHPYECHAEFSPCGRWLSVDAQLFQVSSGKSLWTPLAGDGWLLHFQGALKFSPDGRFLCGRVMPQVTGKKDGFEEGKHDVWEVASGTRIARIAANQVGRVAISPDNRTFAYVTGYGVHLFNLVSGKPLAEYEDPGVNCANFMSGEAATLVFSPDGRFVATAHHDGSILVWKVPQSPAPKLTVEERDAAWDDLASAADPVKSRQAVDRLARDPEGAMAILESKFKAPAAPAAADVPLLIRGLDSAAFAEREKAMRRLREAGPKIQPALREALKTATAESKERIERLLADLDPTPRLPLTGETLRGVRAIEVLERIGTGAAKKQLQAWADQTGELYLASEARLASERLQLKEAPGATGK
jgi:RNA polymerase sigma factor (sigma-70 family)